MANEFSVYWWDPNGNYYPEARFINAEAASELAISMTRRPAALIGIIRKVIIIDGGDHTNLVWEYGKGFTFPPELAERQ